MKQINVTKNKGKYLLIPIIIIIAGIIMYFVQGFNFDIEFMGGIKMQVNMGAPFNNEEVASYLEEKTGITPIIVQTIGDGTQASIKTQPIEEDEKNGIISALKEQYQVTDDGISSSSASPSFGLKVQQKTLIFTIIAILCILAYIALRFEWRSAITAILALIINIFIMMSVYLISYTPLNTTFIAAMLTVIGYSINNTIVVFDRIRENLRFYSKKASIAEIVNGSVNQTLARSINTSVTTLLTLLALYFFGGVTTRDFVFAMILGILIGTYSSIFFASTILVWYKEKHQKGKTVAKAE